MNEQVSFTLRGRNPDVLTCIANLSNDEVFTPPELAGRMLDMLAEAWAKDHGGSDLWADKTVRFLDPFTKSGVFLREITSRLTEGLAQQMPDLQERVDHILTQQVFGIGITVSPACWRGAACIAPSTPMARIRCQGLWTVMRATSGSSDWQYLPKTWVKSNARLRGQPRRMIVARHWKPTPTHSFTDNIKTRMTEFFGDHAVSTSSWEPRIS